MTAILKGKELDEYNKKVYSSHWLRSSESRLGTDYYEKDHNRDTLETLIKSHGNKVLECGIGTGEFFALGLARNNKQVYGIDFSAELLGDCRIRFEKEGYRANLAMSDAQAISFKDGIFDAVYAIGVMPYMHDPGKAVSDMLRVTRKGGIVLFDMMSLWHISQFINYWYRVFEASSAGFSIIYRLKRFKEMLGLKTHYKDVPEKVNYRLISPLKMIRILRRMPARYRVLGYNVLLPLNLPVLGRAGNLCERSRLFSRGLKENAILKYFGAKLVVVMEKL